MAQTKYAREMKGERSLAPFIPFSSHLTPTVLLGNDTSICTVFELVGTGFETKSVDGMDTEHNFLCSFLKGLSEEGVALWTHLIRREESSEIGGVMTNAVCQQISDDYNTMFDKKVLVNRYYVTLILKAPSTVSGLGGLGVRIEDELVRQRRIENSLETLDKLKSRFLTALSGYTVRQLGCLDAPHGRQYSEPLQLFHYLLSGKWMKIVVPDGLISETLADAVVAIGRDTLCLKSFDQTRYLQGFEIKEYPQVSWSGMFDSLLYQPFELILTQSFSIKARQPAKEWLRQHKLRMNNSGEIGSQKEQLGVAQVELSDGEWELGEYHFSCFVLGDNIEAVKANVIAAQNGFLEMDIRTVPISLAMDASFFAQLPMNWSYRPRLVHLTTRNFAGFCAFHNFILGKKSLVPWQDAVIRFNTIGENNAPYYFNFHHVSPFGNDVDKKELANTTIIGKSGTGKSVLMALFIVMMQKYAETTLLNLVIFDKDRNLEALVKALGGVYSQIKSGEPTGFNPFALPPTPSNLSFLKKLCRLILKPNQGELTDMEIERIDHAVEDVMALPSIQSRRISRLKGALPQGNSVADKTNSMNRRLARWCQGGEFGWIFDNETDSLNFDARWIVGVDGTDLLKMDSDIKTPISLYLLHRMDEVIDGRRFAYLMDEAWAWINDDAFKDFVGDKQVTIRNQNGFGIFATQNPDQFIRSKIAMELKASCATEMYLPNSKGTRQQYVDEMGLTEKEFQLLKSFKDDSRLCLIKKDGVSVICSLALPTSILHWLPVLSISSDQLPFLENAIKQMGDDPNDWIPTYLASIK